MSNANTSEKQSSHAEGYSRRGFMAGAGAAAAGLTILRPELVWGYQANEKVDIGFIGCGGRGTWIAELFRKHSGYNIVAAADYFQDRLDDFGGKLNVKAEARYPGLAGYKRMLQQKLDAIVVESPPYFHPEHAAAGVAAGKHVYLAKPIAVDVPGCKTVEESGKTGTSNGLCFLVDFQTRADQFYIEALRRVHAGAIGKFAFGESTYHADNPWKDHVKFADQMATNPESALARLGTRQGAVRRHHHRAEHPHARRGQLDHAAATGVRVRHRRAQGPRLRRLLGHVQRHVQVSQTMWASPSARVSSTGTALNPMAFSTGCSARRAYWKPAMADK